MDIRKMSFSLLERILSSICQKLNILLNANFECVEYYFVLYIFKSLKFEYQYLTSA